MGIGHKPYARIVNPEGRYGLAVDGDSISSAVLFGSPVEQSSMVHGYAGTLPKVRGASATVRTVGGNGDGRKSGNLKQSNRSNTGALASAPYSIWEDPGTSGDTSGDGTQAFSPLSMGRLGFTANIADGTEVWFSEFDDESTLAGGNFFESGDNVYAFVMYLNDGATVQRLRMQTKHGGVTTSTATLDLTDATLGNVVAASTGTVNVYEAGDMRLIEMRVSSGSGSTGSARIEFLAGDGDESNGGSNDKEFIFHPGFYAKDGVGHLVWQLGQPSWTAEDLARRSGSNQRRRTDAAYANLASLSNQIGFPLATHFLQIGINGTMTEQQLTDIIEQASAQRSCDAEYIGQIAANYALDPIQYATNPAKIVAIRDVVEAVVSDGVPGVGPDQLFIADFDALLGDNIVDFVPPGGSAGDWVEDNASNVHPNIAGADGLAGLAVSLHAGSNAVTAPTILATTFSDDGDATAPGTSGSYSASIPSGTQAVCVMATTLVGLNPDTTLAVTIGGNSATALDRYATLNFNANVSIFGLDVSELGLGATETLAWSNHTNGGDAGRPIHIVAWALQYVDPNPSNWSADAVGVQGGTTVSGTVSAASAGGIALNMIGTRRPVTVSPATHANFTANGVANNTTDTGTATSDLGTIYSHAVIESAGSVAHSCNVDPLDRLTSAAVWIPYVAPATTGTARSRDYRARGWGVR